MSSHIFKWGHSLHTYNGHACMGRGSPISFAYAGEYLLPDFFALKLSRIMYVVMYNLFYLLLEL